MRLIDADALKDIIETYRPISITSDYLQGKNNMIDYCIAEIDNAPTIELQIGRITLGDLLRTLRTAQYERVEIRDDYGNEILTCPTDTEGVTAYMDYTVIEWFPRGAPNKDATFTVYVRSKEMQNEPGEI